MVLTLESGFDMTEQLKNVYNAMTLFQAISASGPGHKHDHSSSEDAHGDDDHNSAIWKGFVLDLT